MNLEKQKIIENDSKKRIDAEKVCDKHTEPFSEVSYDLYKCKSCAEEEMYEHLEREANRLAMEKANKALILPGRLNLYSFENYKPSKESNPNLNACKLYVKGWPDVGGMLMLGGVGTGKTHLAVSICKALRDVAATCRMTTVNRIIRAVRSSWNKNTDDTEAKIILRYVEYDLLVIDEIGSQYGSDSERVIINEIINDRYEMDHKTILIGNVSITEANEILGKRVIDRVTHNGDLLFFEWDSYRKARS